MKRRSSFDPTTPQHAHLHVGSLFLSEVVGACFQHLRKSRLRHDEAVWKANHCAFYDTLLMFSPTLLKSRSQSKFITLLLAVSLSRTVIRTWSQLQTQGESNPVQGEARPRGGLRLM